MKKALYLILVIMLSISCDSTEPEENMPEEKITLDILNTEPEIIQLKFTSTNINKTDSINIYRQSSPPVRLAAFYNDVAETTIVDKNSGLGLEWNTTYSYYAEIIGKTNKTTTLIETTTGEPDTTTQDFTFQVFELGDSPGANSFANDVWVFSENNVWVVGKFKLGENNTNTYTVIHWDGEKWIPVNQIINSFGVDAIWAADEDNIFIASQIMYKYNGTTFDYWDFSQMNPKGAPLHIWGVDKNHVWAVGTEGLILYYDGIKWKELDFPENYYFRAITGDINEGVAYASAVDINKTNTIIVKISDVNTEIVFESEDYNIELNLIEFIKYEKEKLICFSESFGKTLWEFNLANNSIAYKEIEEPVGISIDDGHYSNSKDIYFVGDDINGECRLLHYNGNKGKIINLPYNNIFKFSATHGIKNFTVSCGNKNNTKSIIIFVRREL